MAQCLGVFGLCDMGKGVCDTVLSVSVCLGYVTWGKVCVVQ